MASPSRRAQAQRDLEDAERVARAAMESLERASARLNRLENEPAEPKRGSVIKFAVQFPQGTILYTYVAYRGPSGDWYVTGRVKAHTWDQVLDLMLQDETAKRYGIGFYLMGAKSGRWVGREQARQ